MSIKLNNLDTSWLMSQNNPDKTLKLISLEADMNQKSRASILNADDIRMRTSLWEERFSNWRKLCLITDPKTVERILICWMKGSSNFKVKTLSPKTQLLCWDNKSRDWLWLKDRNPQKSLQFETNCESGNKKSLDTEASYPPWAHASKFNKLVSESWKTIYAAEWVNQAKPNN